MLNSWLNTSGVETKIPLNKFETTNNRANSTSEILNEKSIKSFSISATGKIKTHQ